MSRIPRKNYCSNYFHIIVQGIEKKYIFELIRYKKKYKQLLLEQREKYHIKILAYCIMDNHCHVLVKVNTIRELSRYMQVVNGTFASFYNFFEKRVGYVFRDRYKSEPVLSLKQLYMTLIYIHLNPIKANMCGRPNEYEFSSYNDYIQKKGIYEETLQEDLDLKGDNFIQQFEFMHYYRVSGIEYEKRAKEEFKDFIIREYLEKNKGIHLTIQDAAFKKMLRCLKEEGIFLADILAYFKKGELI